MLNTYTLLQRIKFNYSLLPDINFLLLLCILHNMLHNSRKQTFITECFFINSGDPTSKP